MYKDRVGYAEWPQTGKQIFSFVAEARVGTRCKTGSRTNYCYRMGGKILDYTDELNFMGTEQSRSSLQC